MGENRDIFQEMFIAGLGAVSESAEKVKEVVDNIVKDEEDGKGKEFVDEAVQKGTSFGKELESKIFDIVSEQFNKISLTSHPDFQKLIAEISTLKDKLAKVEADKKEKEEPVIED